jgi:UDP-N-acetylglucosamine:LPS N-acetylglucosamine transferase
MLHTQFIYIYYINSFGVKVMTSFNHQYSPMRHFNIYLRSIFKDFSHSNVIFTHHYPTLVGK